MAKKKESTALAVTLAHDKALGQVFTDSGLFQDTKDKDQAVVKILAGREIGLQPIEAMTGLNIISGKITISGNVMASKVKANEKYNYHVKKITNHECTIEFFEGEKNIGTSSFTMEDAAKITYWDSKAGKKKKLSEKDNWINYSRNMLFNRALSNGVRWYCPDVFGHSPVYVPEEMGVDVNEEGEAINITPDPDVEKHDERPDVPPIEEAEFDDDPDEPEPEQDEDTDTATLTLPEDLVNDTMKPREALDAIMKYAVDNSQGAFVRPVIIEHYPKYTDGSRYPYHIPETKVIKIVEELTGIKLKKAEKIKKCIKKECGAKVTEPEAEEQQDDDGKPLCLKCWQKEND